MRINIRTYGNVVTVDGESHVVDKNLTQLFPGVAAITYDHETGVGHVEYLPTPSHTFYGMDGLKGLSDVLSSWNKECEACEKILQERLAKMDEALASLPEDTSEEERANAQLIRDEFAARIERIRTPDTAQGERDYERAKADNVQRRAPVVIEDF